VATLYNYACHPSAAGGDSPPVVSADFPGFASHMIETCHGGTALFLHGCSGDINPAKYVRGDSHDFDDRIADARRMGQILGAEVLKTAATIRTAQVERYRVVQGECLLPVRDECCDVARARQNAHEAVAAWKETGTDPRTGLRKYVMARKLRDGGCPVVMFALGINDAAVGFIPGEPFTAYGERLKGASPSEVTLIAATCGEDPFYIPTAEAFAQGGYETGYVASADTGATLFENARALLEACCR
jgi:hypothetical protein